MLAITYEKYGPPEVLELAEVPTPELREKDILVKVHATSITKGECEMRSPEIFSTVWFIARLFFGLRKPRFKVLGSYFAGEVVTTADEVSSFKTGERVFGITGSAFGAYAQFVRIPESDVVTTIPENVSYAEAAPVGLGIDSLHFINKLKLKSGERLLINGAGGGIGTYAVQLAKKSGTHVTVVDSGDKLDMLKKLGADAVIDYTSEKVSGSYEAIFDVVGTIKFRKSLGLLARNGRYVSAIPEFDRMILNALNTPFSGKKIMTGLTAPKVEHLQELADLLENEELHSVIDREFSMSEIVEAHKYIEAGKKIGNSILLPQHS